MKAREGKFTLEGRPPRVVVALAEDADRLAAHRAAAELHRRRHRRLVLEHDERAALGHRDRLHLARRRAELAHVGLGRVGVDVLHLDRAAALAALWQLRQLVDDRALVRVPERREREQG